MSSSKEIFIRLYIDEDVHGSIGGALRRKGYDVITVHEMKREGLSDTEQLNYAVQDDRAIFSFNAVDYIELHIQYLKADQEHAGIIVSKQLPFSETLHRLVKLLDQVSVDGIRNQLRWLP